MHLTKIIIYIIGSEENIFMIEDRRYTIDHLLMFCLYSAINSFHKRLSLIDDL